jgi:hypothetical protein
MYLDKRNATTGLDLKIAPSMTSRAEIMKVNDQRTDVTVQELINAFCDLTDGMSGHEIVGNTGCSEDWADRILAIRSEVKTLWTNQDGTKVID